MTEEEKKNKENKTENKVVIKKKEKGKGTVIKAKTAPYPTAFPPQLYVVRENPFLRKNLRIPTVIIHFFTGSS